MVSVPICPKPDCTPLPPPVIVPLARLVIAVTVVPDAAAIPAPEVELIRPLLLTRVLLPVWIPAPMLARMTPVASLVIVPMEPEIADPIPVSWMSPPVLVSVPMKPLPLGVLLVAVTNTVASPAAEVIVPVLATVVIVPLV